MTAAKLTTRLLADGAIAAELRCGPAGLPAGFRLCGSILVTAVARDGCRVVRTDGGYFELAPQDDEQGLAAGAVWKFAIAYKDGYQILNQSWGITGAYLRTPDGAAHAVEAELLEFPSYPDFPAPAPGPAPDLLLLPTPAAWRPAAGSCDLGAGLRHAGDPAAGRGRVPRAGRAPRARRAPAPRRRRRRVRLRRRRPAGRGLRAADRGRARDAARRRRQRALLRHGVAAAARGPARRPRPLRDGRGPAALRLARHAHRLRPALPSARLPATAARPLRAAQAQPLPLAPGRRRGLPAGSPLPARARAHLAARPRLPGPRPLRQRRRPARRRLPGRRHPRHRGRPRPPTACR